jgi:hypothetical protein
MDASSYTADQKQYSPKRIKEALSDDDFKVQRQEERWCALTKKNQVCQFMWSLICKMP